MKVAVVTPYHREPPATLLRCCQSVSSQSICCTHFLVSDGFPQWAVDSRKLRHILLPTQHSDNGNAARAIGGMCALNEGFEAIAFLDADNWYDADHVKCAVSAAEQSEADVVFTPRRIWLANGLLCPFEDEDIVARRTADTSSIVLVRRGLPLSIYWGLMPPSLSPICDRVIIAAISSLGLAISWADTATVNYESRWPAHYAALGLPAPHDFHETDWDSIEQTYCRTAFVQAYGFDPFDGVGPGQASHKPMVVAL